METLRFSNYWWNKISIFIGAVIFTAPFLYGQQNFILNPGMDSIVLCDFYSGITNGECPNWDVYGESEADFICNGSPNIDVQNFAMLQSSHSGNQHLLIPILIKRKQNLFLEEGWSELSLATNITGTFKEPLQQGQRYKLDFFVSEMGGGIASQYPHIYTNCFDLLLLDSLNTPIINNQQYPSMYPDSMIINLNPSNQLIKDSINWVHLSTCFVAKGGEKYFVVGCLRDTNQILTEVYKNSQDLISRNLAIYSFDTFSLYECDTCCGNTPPTPPFEENVLVANNPSSLEKPIQFKVSIPETKSAKIAIYDNAGRLIEEAYLTSDSSLFSPTKKYARGMYYYSFISSTGYSKIGKWLQM